MISFLYQGHTYYANVINYGQAPPRYFISIINASPGIAKEISLRSGNHGFELTNYSPSAVPKELVDAIAEKLSREVKAGVAQKI